MRSGGFCGGRGVAGYGAGLSTKGPVEREMTIEERAAVAFDRLKEEDQVAVRLRYGKKLVDWFRVYNRDPFGRLFGDGDDLPEQESL